MSNRIRTWSRLPHPTTVALAAVIAACGGAGAAPSHHAQQEWSASEDTRTPGEAIMAIVSLQRQHITIYDTKGWILRAPVSTGQKGRETPAGIFSVLEKEAEHYSNLYDDAFMPHMQRLTWSGIALHGGVLPGHPASHGCIRMPYEFAGRLFDVTKVGMRVIIAPGDAAPVTIAHPVLFAADLECKRGGCRQGCGRAKRTRRPARSIRRDWRRRRPRERRLAPA